MKPGKPTANSIFKQMKRLGLTRGAKKDEKNRSMGVPLQKRGRR